MCLDLVIMLARDDDQQPSNLGGAGAEPPQRKIWRFALELPDFPHVFKDLVMPLFMELRSSSDFRDWYHRFLVSAGLEINPVGPSLHGPTTGPTSISD